MVLLPDNSPRFTPPKFEHGRVFILGVPYVPEATIVPRESKPDDRTLRAITGTAFCIGFMASSVLALIVQIVLALV